MDGGPVCQQPFDISRNCAPAGEAADALRSGDEVLRVARKERANVLDGYVQQARTSSERGPGQVRGDDAIPGPEQRMVRRGRFLREHVQTRVCQRSGIETV